LEIDGPVLVENREDDGRAARGQAARAGEVAGAGVGADLVGAEDLVAEPAGVQVFENASASGAPEGVVAALDVVAECLPGEGGWLWPRDANVRGARMGLDGRSWASGVESGALREVFEGLAEAEGGGFEEEVDGGAAAAAAVAVPALVAAGGGEDVEGGCRAGLGSVVG